ncbi:GNAT family N-acetyltransferase [Photobacterium sp. SDRW27]|uniref:GNAT family N-acetyltransferase n=1 Tax=Photobacterium obscurum TaxID=2829490 RepID=UPI00224343EF|nr:GNAT family N-acetyltransferase [Photobacterium obscurum]MCW8330984.1 GNAT family N-acetyltransferase [Photobacterium obscurum]
MKIERIAAEQTLPVRHRVLWPEQPIDFCRVPEDDIGCHYGVFTDNQLVCVASVFIDGTTARLRKFATLPEYQGQGIGTRMIEQILADLKSNGINTFWCDARESATGFYRQFAMSPQGERFYKANIAYFKMAIEF